MTNKLTFNPYKALKSIIEVTSLHTGKDFIKTTAKEIKNLFQADLVFIAWANKDIKKAKIIYATNKNLPKKYELKNNPSLEIYKKNKIIKINKHVKYTFDKSNKSKYESFLGIPIKDDKDKCIGHIAIFSNEIRDIPKEMEDIALIYAKKIEVETKRLKLEKENKKIRRELEKLIITDPLTKLNNRRHFITCAKNTLAQVQRNVTIATLAYIDLDNFKAINDKYGHKGGDVVLSCFAEILKKETRSGVDSIFRIGGEEFCIISLNANIEQSEAHLKRIMNETKDFFSSTLYGEITLSIGLIEFLPEHETYENTIHIADEKMYIAKNSGKNQIVK